jgi:hypothetical protein
MKNSFRAPNPWMTLPRRKMMILLLERGQGDSVEEIAKYWGDRSIDEIHHQVMMWKTQQPHQ